MFLIFWSYYTKKTAKPPACKQQGFRLRNPYDLRGGEIWAREQHRPSAGADGLVWERSFFQNHGDLGVDGGFDELGGIVGGEEELLAGGHVLYGAQALLKLVLAQQNGEGDT